MNHKIYDNLLFFPLFSLPSQKKSEEEKENELSKPVLNIFFCDPFDFHLLLRYLSKTFWRSRRKKSQYIFYWLVKLFPFCVGLWYNIYCFVLNRLCSHIKANQDKISYFIFLGLKIDILHHKGSFHVYSYTFRYKLSYTFFLVVISQNQALGLVKPRGIVIDVVLCVT